MSRVRLALLLVALGVYVALLADAGGYLLTQPRIALKALGAAVLVLALLGLWVAGAELRFAAATGRLTALLDHSDPASLPRSADGDVDRAAADELFAVRRDQVRADPADWSRWYRLAIAYELAGDRKRARSAMRTAIGRAAEVRRASDCGIRDIGR